MLTIIETTGGSGMYEYFLQQPYGVYHPDGVDVVWRSNLSIYELDRGCFGQSDAGAISTPTEINVGFQSNAVWWMRRVHTPDGEISCRHLKRLSFILLWMGKTMRRAP